MFFPIPSMSCVFLLGKMSSAAKKPSTMKYGSKTTLKEILKTKKNNLKRGTIITLFSTKFLLFLLSGV